MKTRALMTEAEGDLLRGLALAARIVHTPGMPGIGSRGVPQLFGLARTKS
jgi:hypothetical protein